MFDLFHLRTTQSKFLKILTDNCDLDLDDPNNVLHQKFPNMTQYDIDSHLWALDRSGYINVLGADNKIFTFLVQPTAIARMQETYELRKSDRMWDAAKIIVGFILGYITHYLVNM